MRSEEKWRVCARLSRKSAFVPILLIVLCGVSCRAPKNGTGLLLPKPVEIPKLVPVAVPPDSAWLRAYLACDSNNRVIMRAFEERKGKGISSTLRMDGGILDFHVVFLHDTLYVPGKDSLVYVPVDVPGPVTNGLTWWQELWIRLGKLLAAGIGTFAIARLVLKRLK